MTYQSVHTGPEVDAAVAVLNDVQEIRTEVEGYKNTVVSLAGQVQTDAGNVSSDAATALQAASDALDSKNAAYASEQAASGHAANADSSRALAVVARNGSEAARDEAWATEGRINQLLSDSEPTIDELRAAIRRIHYGDGPYPSLDLNFIGATMLDPRITFTRASAATYWDARGVLQAAQPNEPRFDYDPVTGESLGLLVEGQVTNLLLHSEDFDNSYWGKYNTTCVGGVTTAPDGVVSASKVVPNSGATLGTWLSQTPIQKGVVAVEGKTYSFSLYAKAAEFDSILMRVINDPSDQNVRFNLVTGEATVTQGSGFPYTIEPVGGGWHRCSITFTHAGESSSVRWSAYDSVFTTGDGASGIYVWGAQLEEGSAPSSYIKTEASQVTRAAERTEVTVSDFLFDPSYGTIVVDASLDYLGSFWSAFAVLGSSNEYIGLIHGNSGIRVYARAANGSGSFSTPDRWMGLIPHGRFRAAMSFDPSGGKVSFDGGEALSFAPPASGMPSDMGVLGLGTWGGATTVGGKHLRCITYFPRALPDAKLVELTTL